MGRLIPVYVRLIDQRGRLIPVYVRLIDQRGQTIAEYGLIIAAIAIIVLVVAFLLGGSISSVLSRVSTRL